MGAGYPVGVIEAHFAFHECATDNVRVCILAGQTILSGFGVFSFDGRGRGWGGFGWRGCWCEPSDAVGLSSAGRGRFSGKSRAASGAWRAVDERSAEFAGLRGWFIGEGGEIVVGVLQVVFVRYATRFVGVVVTSRWRGWGIVV